MDMYFVGGIANRLCFSVKYRKFAEFIQKIAKKSGNYLKFSSTETKLRTFAAILTQFGVLHILFFPYFKFHSNPYNKFEENDYFIIPC